MVKITVGRLFGWAGTMDSARERKGGHTRILHYHQMVMQFCCTTESQFSGAWKVCRDSVSMDSVE
jgi:hypothetical protein